MNDINSQSDIQPELVSLRAKLTASIEQCERERDTLSKQIEKDRELLHAINSSLSIKVAKATGRGGLAGTVRAVIRALPNTQFTAPDVERALLAQFPTIPSNKSNIRTALWNMLSKKELRTIRKGNNRVPALYERVDPVRKRQRPGWALNGGQPSNN